MIKEVYNPKIASQEFYHEALQLLLENNFSFLIGGGFALFHYTGIYRDTKDLDIFCRPSEYSSILKFFSDYGFKTELTDSRWLAKIFKEDYYIDIIFSTVNCICVVDDSWYKHATKGELFGIGVQFIPAEELIWCKSYVQNRERFDGADINHVILKYGKKLDWKRLWMRLEQHWQILLTLFINFQFIYPNQRDQLPKWLFDELITKAKEQYYLPLSSERVCRGPLIDQTQYEIDIKKWNFKVVTMKTV